MVGHDSGYPSIPMEAKHNGHNTHGAIRAATHKKNGKYTSQRERTAANKARKLAKYRRVHPNWRA